MFSMLSVNSCTSLPISLPLNSPPGSMLQFLHIHWSSHCRKNLQCPFVFVNGIFQNRINNTLPCSFNVLGIWNLEFDSSMSHKTLNMIKTKLGRITSKWCIPSKLFLSHSYCLINQMKQQDSINNDTWPLVWEATPKTLALCFVGISRHLETIKLLMLRPHTFFCFTVSGYPDESLALLFYILRIHLSRVELAFQLTSIFEGL